MRPLWTRGAFGLRWNVLKEEPFPGGGKVTAEEGFCERSFIEGVTL
jgi:hypothetical protein